MVDHVGARALVLGGSMAGLLAARVLADAYDEVLVVDRDELIGVTEPRRGVPQGRHVHGLLARGQQTLEELFPGFTEEAERAGAPTGDLGAHRWYIAGRQARRAVTGVGYISFTRPVLENFVRTKVAALPNVEFRTGRDIVGLLSTPDGSRITGARVRAGAEGSEEEAVLADLVVDATGRGSRTPTWLTELGYDRPAEDRIKIDLSYTTRQYRNPNPGVIRGDRSINPLGSPATPRGAFLSEMEHGKWILSVTTVLGERAPADPAGFTEFLKTLPVPDLYDAVRDAEPLDDPVSFRYPASVRRRYERLARFPERFLVVGDAMCSFNPVYGQGMTVSALESLTLREHLRRGVPAPLPFLRDIAKVIDAPWDISAGGDLAFPQVEGERPAKVRLGNAYMGKVQAAATRDPVVLAGFMRVAGLIDKPQDLMRPPMMVRVLLQAWLANRDRKRAAAATVSTLDTTRTATARPEDPTSRAA
ncbi:FAD-dependent oxidoreductase [Actinophytocola sediminis]